MSALSKIGVSAFRESLPFGMSNKAQRNVPFQIFSRSFPFPQTNAQIGERLLRCNARCFSTSSDKSSRQNFFEDTQQPQDQARLDFAKFLLEKGADPRISDSTGQTPLDTAIIKRDLGMIKLLTSLDAPRSLADRARLKVLSVLHESKKLT